MRKHGLAAMLLFTTVSAFSQTPDDALRQSYQIQQGTARNMAVGGAAGSLGGDITSAYINPAGIGFYKTGEVVLSSGWNFIGTNFNYRGTDQKDKKNAFTYGPIGLVYGWQNAYNPRKSTAFSISINQVANFNNTVNYTGLNNATSWSEQYLEELVRNRADTNSALDDYRFGSSLAYRTFLVDTTMANGQVSGYKSLVDIASGVTQANNINTRGGIHEINIALASNSSDKFYIGGSIGIPIYSYTRDQNYSETDASGKTNNNFAYFRYNEHYTSKGVGVNLRLGAIYKPVEKVRLGLALHSPTFANMTDQIRTSITTNTEGYYRGDLTATSNQLNNSLPGQYRYTMTTPWKAILSGTYIFNEVSDVRRQKGFITADAEYIRQQGTQYAIIEGGSLDDDAYYKLVNQAIDARYKGTFNFRLGGEVKFTNWMVRAGAAHYGNPYQESLLKNNRTLLSTGLGYRNRGMFVDLTFIHSIVNDTNIPYYLADVDNTFASGKNTKENVMLTVGFKF